MKIIKTRAYARAGLIGNPSDGYFGKTISIIVKNFYAQVVIYEWPTLEIIPSPQDTCKFDSSEDFLKDLNLNGYYGGMRLVKGSIKKFFEHCEKEGFLNSNSSIKNKNFSIRYESNIPRQVGLAGSSAIVTATIKGLCQFFDVSIQKEILPALILSVEKEELGIGAGLQDRVAQVYEGVTYMDFDKETIERRGYGIYESLDKNLLPNLYVAYQTNLAEPSELFHNNIRQRYDSGEKLVIDSINLIADLALKGKDAILKKDYKLLAELMNKNFDTRRKIFNLNPKHIEMVEVARSTGASAKFAGSGGGIIGTYENENMYESLVSQLKGIGCNVIRPII